MNALTNKEDEVFTPAEAVKFLKKTKKFAVQSLLRAARNKKVGHKVMGEWRFYKADLIKAFFPERGE